MLFHFELTIKHTKYKLQTYINNFINLPVLGGLTSLQKIFNCYVKYLMYLFLVV